MRQLSSGRISVIKGIGIDIIEIKRLEQALNKKKFKNDVFTKGEQVYCDSQMKNSIASYAARFAAKEAVFKALKTGIFTRMIEVEVVNDENGSPRIVLHNKVKELAISKKIENFSISLSHSREYATAICVIE